MKIPAHRQEPVSIPQDGNPRVGIFGGQGPAAGADAAVIFQSVQGSKAREQDYVGSELKNDPAIPDRTAFIKKQPGAEDPFPAMHALIQELDQVKRVSVMFIPCNTAHTWHSRLAPTVNATLLNMPRATAKQLKEEGVPAGSKIGVMCTDGTIQQQLYTKALEAQGYEVVYPQGQDQADVMHGIYQGVKKNDSKTGFDKMAPVLDKLLDQGCAKVLLACTEIPLALNKSTVGEKVSRTLNPVEAVAKRALVHVGRMNEAKAAGRTTYDFGSDGEVSEREDSSDEDAASVTTVPERSRYARMEGGLRRVAPSSDLRRDAED